MLIVNDVDRSKDRGQLRVVLDGEREETLILW